MDDLKTSEEWQTLCKIVVLDPDGWDRENYAYSWHKEKINREEFENRLWPSTCLFPETIDFGEPSSIWRDKEQS